MSEKEEGPTFGEAVKGLFSGVKGFGIAGVWAWRNWKTVAFAISLFTAGTDQFVGPHLMKRAWHGVKHGQAQETADESWNKFGPVLNDIHADGKATREQTILLTMAFKRLPGGAKAIQGAMKERIQDSINEARWHPPQANTGNGEQLVQNMATIKPAHWHNQDPD